MVDAMKFHAGYNSKYFHVERAQRQFMRAVSGRDVCARLDGVPDGYGLRTRRIGNRLSILHKCLIVNILHC